MSTTNQSSRDALAAARKRGRSAYMTLAVVSAVFGLLQLGNAGGVVAFVPYVFASIMAIIVRHCMLPGGVEDLLQWFARRGDRR